jgi:hypothetical protein
VCSRRGRWWGAFEELIINIATSCRCCPRRLSSSHRQSRWTRMQLAPARRRLPHHEDDAELCDLGSGASCSTRSVARWDRAAPKRAIRLHPSACARSSRGRDRRQSGYGNSAGAWTRGHTPHSKFVPGCTCRTRLTSESRSCRACWTATGPVAQDGGTCRIQYTTCSELLRDDVLYLVRSLGVSRIGGGVRLRGDARSRKGPPRHVPTRRVCYRHPTAAGIEPFRLRRKLELYRKSGGGRPMRFIDSIEPAARDRQSAYRSPPQTPSTSPTTSS